MNAFKIWIATHPDEADNQEVTCIEPVMKRTHIYSDSLEWVAIDPAYAVWVEHICIPIQE
jgi:hypothetical protein